MRKYAVRDVTHHMESRRAGDFERGEKRAAAVMCNAA